MHPKQPVKRKCQLVDPFKVEKKNEYENNRRKELKEIRR